jgi:trehalose 6-phosphate phosphatase
VKNILGDKQRAVLGAFLRKRVLVAFDFDGTLSPIVSRPGKAGISAKTRRLLEEVAVLYPCALISGRARGDVLERVAGIPFKAVFGNHGIEPVRNPRAIRRLVDGWLVRLSEGLPSIPGVIVEDKDMSVALHYRQGRNRPKLRRLLLEAAKRLPGARIVEGKMVVNVLPEGTGDKGTALVGLCRRLRCECAIYVGDDDNDEDAFALASQGRLLGIRVGRSRNSKAQYFLPRQTAINHLLTRLVTSPGSVAVARRNSPRD